MASFALKVETVFGDGSITELGQRAKAAGFKHALVVTDPGIRAAGILDSVLSSRDEAEIAHTVYENVTPNPTLPEVDGGVKAMADSGADFVVGVGGGSAIDAAKGIAVTAHMGGVAKTYLFGAGTVPFPSGMKMQ